MKLSHFYKSHCVVKRYRYQYRHGYRRVPENKYRWSYSVFLKMVLVHPLTKVLPKYLVFSGFLLYFNALKYFKILALGHQLGPPCGPRPPVENH